MLLFAEIHFLSLKDNENDNDDDNSDSLFRNTSYIHYKLFTSSTNALKN